MRAESGGDGAKQNDGVHTFPPPFAAAESSCGVRISPTILIIIVVLAFLFFISGVLHLLMKYLAKHGSPLRADDEGNEIWEPNVLQRQLQELFHLHDCGLDQSVIDALPVFVYKDITGPKEPYDCAVCLCEFKDDDKLRLLPMCSHAFHTVCIDTWLLSWSTCPICRNSLFAAGFSVNNPIFESGELGEDEGNSCSGRKNLDVEQQMTANEVGNEPIPVRLGKFKRLDEQVSAHEAGCEETSSSNFDCRRCYSMGSYQYIVGETGLHISLSQDRRTRNERFFRANNQELDDSSSSFKDMEAKKICNAAKGESLSVSKIWMWPKASRFDGSSDIEMGLPLPFPSSLDANA